LEASEPPVLPRLLHPFEYSPEEQIFKNEQLPAHGCRLIEVVIFGEDFDHGLSSVLMLIDFTMSQE